MLLFSLDGPDVACLDMLGYLVDESWAPVIYLFTNFHGIIKSEEQLWFLQFKHATECLKGLPLLTFLHTVELHSLMHKKLKKGYQSKPA